MPKNHTNSELISVFFIEIGNYDTLEEAVLARISKEKEVCGEYGPNKDLFYLVEAKNPLEEIKNYLKENNIDY